MTIMDLSKLTKEIRDGINSYCAHKYQSGHREHLGASVMGESCSRKLFYIFRWCKLEKFSGRMVRLFQVGHNFEPRATEYLRACGFEVHEAQIKITGCNDHYGGSIDAKAYDPTLDKYFICEFKTSGTGIGFTDVETKGLEKAKPKHWAQMCQYGYKHGIKYGIYLIENKNDSDITVQVVELDWELGHHLENKAFDIIEAKSPPHKISQQPSYYECKYCNFQDICHFGEAVEENCRSCKNASPVERGEWFCSKYSTVIPKDQIPLKHECHESINT